MGRDDGPCAQQPGHPGKKYVDRGAHADQGQAAGEFQDTLGRFIVFRLVNTLHGLTVAGVQDGSEIIGVLELLDFRETLA